MTRDERIEAVRRAICCPDGCWLSASFPNDPTACQARHEVEDAIVRAAIRATLQSLLEPSEGMAVRAVYTADFDRVTTAEAIWLLMIQQAIKEMTDD